MTEETKFNSAYSYDAPMHSDFSNYTNFLEGPPSNSQQVASKDPVTSDDIRKVTDWVLDTCNAPMWSDLNADMNDYPRERFQDFTPVKVPSTTNGHLTKTDTRKKTAPDGVTNDNIKMRTTSNRKAPSAAVLTSLARRRSSVINCRRRCSNRYANLAEEVRKFQTQTPPRSHTPSSEKIKLKAPLRVAHEKLKTKIKTVEKTKVTKKPPQNDKPKFIKADKSTNKTVHDRKKLAVKIVLPTIVSSESGPTFVDTEIRHFGIPVTPITARSAKKKTTTPSPFSFEGRKQHYTPRRIVSTSTQHQVQNKNFTSEENRRPDSDLAKSKLKLKHVQAPGQKA